jgi:hypothetical protein
VIPIETVNTGYVVILGIAVICIVAVLREQITEIVGEVLYSLNASLQWVAPVLAILAGIVLVIFFWNDLRPAVLFPVQ